MIACFKPCISFSICKGVLLLMWSIVNSGISFGQSPQKFSRAKYFKNFLALGENGSYIKILNNAPFSTQNDFSLEAQVKFNQPLNSNGGAIFINTVGPNGSADWGWGFVAISNKFGFHVCTPEPAQIMANQTDTVSQCEWYHLAGVKKGDSLYFYLNGNLKSKAEFPKDKIVRTASGPAQFGFHRSPFTNWFDGNIDEFKFWDYPISQNQIISKMNDTLQGSEEGLIAYYKFNETGIGSGFEVKNSATSLGNQINCISESVSGFFPQLQSTYIEYDCYEQKPELFFQNLITLNGDQLNDCFEIKNLDFYPPGELQIFNRWGEKVYHTSYYRNDWQSSQGVYYYKFRSKGINRKGWIFIVNKS